MKKLFSLLTVLTISGTSIPTVTAVNPYQRQKTTNLSDLIRQVDLGNISNNYEDTILHAIVRLNPRIKMNEIRIAQLFDRRARIVFADAPNNFDINASVLVSFNISSEGMVGNSVFYNHPRLEPHRPAPTIPGGEITSNEIPEWKFHRPTPPVPNKEEPIYATVVPKNQRNKQNPVVLPKPRSLNNFLLKTDLGELSDNLSETIINRLQELNPTLDINQISITDITLTSAMIRSNENTRYTGDLQVTFTLNAKDKQKSNKTNENKPDNNFNPNGKQKIKDIINKFNNLSKEDKQNELNDINDYYQTLSTDGKKDFNNNLKDIGLGLTSTGISGAGILGISKMTGISPINAVGNGVRNVVSVIRSGITNTLATETSATVGTAETIELTPLLSTAGELTAAETLTIEATATAVGEGSIIGAEAAVSASLAPETLGLSIVIGALVMTGTSFLIWWLNSDSSEPTKHESYNKYDEIEKYYKFLAHDQLKLDISPYEWVKIRQIYKKYPHNYEKFKIIVKAKIINFHKEDHSGWGGAITDEDIDILIKIMFDNIKKINQHFSSNFNHGWKIITNTIGSYFVIEAE